MLSKIALSNFKCFESESFNLKELTLFTGINGLGKSSVIQSLLLLKQSYLDKSFNANKVSLYNRSFIDLENCQELCYQNAFPKFVTITLGNEKEESYSWTIDATNPNDKEPSFNSQGTLKYLEEPLFAENFIYLSADRIGPQKSYSLFSSNKSFNTKLGIQGELTPAYIQKSSTENQRIAISSLIHKSLLEENNSDLLYLNLNAWTSEILGRTSTVKVSSIDKENVKMSYIIKGMLAGEFSALQVGFGYSFGLPVILAPLAASPGDLIIIENPEAHLHPSAQTKLGKLLAMAVAGGVQLIIETHSDHILNGIRLAVKDKQIDNSKVKIYFFGENQNEMIIEEPEIDVDGRINKWPDNFFDSWENSLMELL